MKLARCTHIKEKDRRLQGCMSFEWASFSSSGGRCMCSGVDLDPCGGNHLAIDGHFMNKDVR